MSAIKERIFGALTVMSEDDAQRLWQLISAEFVEHSWDDIEAVTPDDFDIKMLNNLDDPDCHSFMSSADAMKELGIDK